MAQVTLSGSNSINVARVDVTNLPGRVKAICYEHALNLLDGTPAADEQTWAYDVLSGNEFGLDSIVLALAVQGNPATIDGIVGATDATIRTNFDLIIGRCIDAWVNHNP